MCHLWSWVEPIFSLQQFETHHWMSFLLVENLDKFNHFILGREFLRSIDVAIDFNLELKQIKDPERRLEKNSVNENSINQAQMTIFYENSDQNHIKLL